MRKSLPPDNVRQEQVLWLVHYGRLDWARAERMSTKQRSALIDTVREWKRKEAEQQNQSQSKGSPGRAARPSAGSKGFATVRKGA